jgi:oligoendopeptidase F
LRHEAILQPSPRGKIPLNEKLIETLKSGGLWSSKDLLKELGVDYNNIEAIEIIQKQLEMLVDFELIEETSRGWRWLDEQR